MRRQSFRIAADLYSLELWDHTLNLWVQVDSHHDRAALVRVGSCLSRLDRRARRVLSHHPMLTAPQQIWISAVQPRTAPIGGRLRAVAIALYVGQVIDGILIGASAVTVAATMPPGWIIPHAHRLIAWISTL